MFSEITVPVYISDVCYDMDVLCYNLTDRKIDIFPNKIWDFIQVIHEDLMDKSSSGNGNYDLESLYRFEESDLFKNRQNETFQHSVIKQLAAQFSNVSTDHSNYLTLNIDNQPIDQVLVILQKFLQELFGTCY